MTRVPREVAQIINTYITDMHLLERTPLPTERATVNPLNVVVFGIFTIADLITHHIVYAYTLHSNSSTSDIGEYMLNGVFSDVITCPVNLLAQFEEATRIYDMRRMLWGISTPALPPQWEHTIPYIVLNFILHNDYDRLCSDVQLWVSTDHYIESLL